MTAKAFLDAHGKAHGVYCVRACVGYVSGHVRGTSGTTARFTHPVSGRIYDVYRCNNCGAYWKKEAKTGV